MDINKTEIYKLKLNGDEMRLITNCIEVFVKQNLNQHVKQLAAFTGEEVELLGRISEEIENFSRWE